MKRYSNIPTFSRYDGKQVYKTTIYPPVTPSTTDLQIVSNETDYLDTLAYKYYSDPTLWFIIALANPGIGKGRMSIPPGLTLRIPVDISAIISQFNSLNS
jgi:phage tail protein X